MPLSGPVRKPTLATQVARQIEKLITSGEWPVATRIPAENELVTLLGVSRNTVREALRSLEHLGMLEARVGDGTYVRSFSELEAPLMRRAHRAKMGEGIELRLILERAAARLAATRRTREDIPRLRAAMRAMRQASMARDRAAYVEADAQLHRTVVACARNDLLFEVYQHLGGALRLSGNPELWDEALATTELNMHAQLVEAITRGDAHAAEGAAAELIDALRSAIVMPANTNKAARRA